MTWKLSNLTLRSEAERLQIFFFSLFLCQNKSPCKRGFFSPLQRWEVIIWRREWKKYNYSILISSFPHPSALSMCLSISKEAKSVWVNTCEERKNSGSKVAEFLAFNTWYLPMDKMIYTYAARSKFMPFSCPDIL